MYEIEEFYNPNGSDLKEIMKSCIYNYYVKNKDVFLPSNDLQDNRNSSIIDMTNKYEILSMKGVNNVQSV